MLGSFLKRNAELIFSILVGSLFVYMACTSEPQDDQPNNYSNNYDDDNDGYDYDDYDNNYDDDDDDQNY